MLTINKLKEFIPFNELDDEYLADLIDLAEIREYERGSMLFKRGKNIETKYYLMAGRIDLIDSDYAIENLEAGTERAVMPLNPDSVTKCSAIAKTSSTIFAITVDDLDRIISWSESAASIVNAPPVREGPNFAVEELDADHEGDWMSSMLQSPLFSRIPLTQIQDLFTRFEDVPVEEGQAVVKEGEKGDYFYVISFGIAHVSNRLKSVDVEIAPGNYFGEEALLGNTVRNATVSMKSRGLLKRLAAEDFNALLKSPVLQYVEKKSLEGMEKPYKLLDVKMPIEFRMNHIPGSINIPLSRLRQNIPSLGRSSIYVVPDDAGSRADIAAHLLCQAGFEAFILKAD